MPSVVDRLIESAPITLGLREWHLIVTYGVLLDAQEATGVPMLSSVEAFVQPSARALRGLLWALLKREDASISVKAVGQLVDLQSIGTIRHAIALAFNASMPDPPKQPAKGKKEKAKKPQPPMTWLETRSAARMELGLTDEEWLAETPRTFHALREVSVHRMRREELLIGQVCEVICNFSGRLKDPKKPVRARDFIMHRLPEDEEHERPREEFGDVLLQHCELLGI